MGTEGMWETPFFRFPHSAMTALRRMREAQARCTNLFATEMYKASGRLGGTHFYHLQLPSTAFVKTRRRELRRVYITLPWFNALVVLQTTSLRNEGPSRTTTGLLLKMPLRAAPPTEGGGGDTKPNRTATAATQSLSKQVEFIEISDDDEDDEPESLANRNRDVSNPKPANQPVSRPEPANSDKTAPTQTDHVDDEFELVYAAGPASAQILAAKDWHSNRVAKQRLECSVRLKEKGKQRAVEEQGEQAGWCVKRIKQSPPGGLGGDATVVPSVRPARYQPRLVARFRMESSEWSEESPASSTSISPPAPMLATTWQPATPPRSTTPTVERIELDLGSIAPPRAPGARDYADDDFWVEPGFSLDLLPFSVKEIPSFERHTWLSLCSHRYLVESRHFPRTTRERADWTARIRSQLLQLFGEKEWAQGEQAEVSFVVMHHLNPRKEFVDIKLFNPRHHALCRIEPGSVALRLEQDALKHFVPAAYVDPNHWLVLQFAHPTIVLAPNQPAKPSHRTELLAFAKIALITLANLLYPHATPKALRNLPDGYPHNPDLAISHNLVNHPEYILVLKRNSPSIPLPAQFHIQRSSAWNGWTGWLPLWWDHKPVDLCRYCKSSTDGHLNSECPEIAKRKDAGKSRTSPIIALQSNSNN